MKKPRIYIDTSVIGGCFDVEFSEWSNGLMHDFAAGTYMPILSDVVAAEVQDAPEAVRQKYEVLLSGEHEFVLVTEEVIELADAYQRRKILTPKFYDDGLHIALATVVETDLLVRYLFTALSPSWAPFLSGMLEGDLFSRQGCAVILFENADLRGTSSREL